MITDPPSRCLLALLLSLSVLPCGATLDLDGGGISDFWQQMYPGLNPAVDTDGDGFDNATEALCGTNPLDPASLFKLGDFGRVEGQTQIFFHWPGVKGKAYTVEQYSTATNQWVAVQTSVATSTGPQALVIPPPGSAGILRLRVTDHDGDGDGLTAWEEGLLGLSDASPISSGQTRQDYSVGFRALEGSGILNLANGSQIFQRPSSRNEIARFLTQASFGPDKDSLDAVQLTGIAAWLDDQLNPGLTTSAAGAAFAHPNTQTTFPYTLNMGIWKGAMTGPDQLRQRVGNALSEIFVISCAGNDIIRQNAGTQADFYDILLGHALGNYRNLLEDVACSTQMGFYLSHLQNRKSDASISRFPDENFAREIMQLFTIGLWELNPDGTRKTDLLGKFIPTYDNTTIMEMAKVFTGFGYGGPRATGFFIPVSAADHSYPMNMWDEEHEPGEKHIVNNVVIPAGQTGLQDVGSALNALCNHPNTGPFVGRLLIQRFTASNPSPAYVGRVAAAWANNGVGMRGDLKAVVEAILIDPEARTPKALGDSSGRVREPYFRMIAMMRAFKARSAANPALFPLWCGDFPNELGQMPMWAPSVFNFYLPDHRPAGELRTRGLVCPELEIATAGRIIDTVNRLHVALDSGLLAYDSNANKALKCNFTYEESIAGNTTALVNYLDGLLTWGQLSASTRAAVITAVDNQATATEKVRTAVHLIVESPDFVVLK